MLFSKRLALAAKADAWCKENKVAQTTLGILSYLNQAGLLNEDEDGS